MVVVDTLCAGWKMFFSSGWGRFEHHFDALLQSIAQTSELIDKEAASVEIIQAREWRQKCLEDAAAREKRWASEQRESVLKWLEVGDSTSAQEVKLEWLRSNCREGTSQWLTKSPQVRSWLQLRRGDPILWLHGKPGSGMCIGSRLYTYMTCALTLFVQQGSRFSALNLYTSCARIVRGGAYTSFATSIRQPTESRRRF